MLKTFSIDMMMIRVGCLFPMRETFKGNGSNTNLKITVVLFGNNQFFVSVLMYLKIKKSSRSHS